MLIPKEAIKLQQPIYMNDKGEVYLKDKSGRPIKLEVDNLGRPF